MTPAPLARDCSTCDGTGRIAGHWCPACAGRGWHPAVAQCVPGQRPGVWDCRTRGPWCAGLPMWAPVLRWYVPDRCYPWSCDWSGATVPDYHGPSPRPCTVTP